MPEENQSPSSSISPTLGKSKRNWKKIALIFLLALFVASLVGVGLYLLVPRLTEEPPSQKQTAPSAKPKEEKPHPLKGKIAFVKSTFIKHEEITYPDGSSGICAKIDSDIFITDPDGTNETKMFDFSSGCGVSPSNLTWSSSGKYLGWFRNGSFEYVESNNLRFKAISKITSVRKKGSLAGFAFSPDEDKVALIETYNPPEIYPLAEDDTSMLVRIIDLTNKKTIETINVIEGTGKIDERMYPRPRSNHVGWIDPTTMVTAFKQNEKFDISSLDYKLGGGLSDRQQITTSERVPYPFAVGNKTEKIAYWKGELNDKELWIADFDGSNSKKLTSIGPLTPSGIKFSEDNKHLIYCSYIGDGVGLTIINLESDKIKKFNASPGFDWGPGSNLIVANNPNLGQSISLILFDIDGKKIRELKKGTSKINYTSPAWFPK